MATKEGIEFMQRSERRNLDPTGEALGLPQPPLELPPAGSGAVVALPAPGGIDLPKADFREVLEKRRTLRRYSAESLTLPELAYLLWLSQGVKRVTDRPVTMRTVPSGGARHPFETFLVVSRVDGLEPGLYRYLAIEHQLLTIRPGTDCAQEMGSVCPGQNHVRDCPVSFWWDAVAQRSTWRYGTRGYRYMMMDAGHVCQNLYLAAESIGCGVCAIGSFDDELMNRFWQLDGSDQFILYGATVGKRPAAGGA